MRRTLASMWRRRLKDELLYEAAVSGNLEAVKALSGDGASFEWFDQEGKTALIAVCLKPELYDVAKTSIELGANVEAYKSGHDSGTPIYHAAKRGYVEIVKLLLSHGANALAMNDDRQTPLDVARFNGFTDVVRLIEHHVSFFTGWLRELHSHSLLGALSPRSHSKKIWVVVCPCGPVDSSKSVKLELAMYNTLQDSKPQTVISHWESKFEKSKFSKLDLVLRVLDTSNGKRYKFGPANDRDKLQILLFNCASLGIRQTTSFIMDPSTLSTLSTNRSTAEDKELAMAVVASIQTANECRPLHLSNSHHSSVGSDIIDQRNLPNCAELNVINELPETVPVNPTAPPLPLEGLDECSVYYPSIDSSPVELPNATTVQGTTNVRTGGSDNGASSCIICWEAPIQCACIPCGHMAGCMSCLSDIKSKKGKCPICRAKIKKVIRIYAV